MGKLINLVGQKFGQLTVVEDVGSKNRKHYWRCICDCGNEKIVDGASLRSGNTKSCGCLKNKGLIEYNLKQSELNKIPINTRFGKLTVIEDIGFIPHVDGHKRRGYKCICDCGNECVASGNQLKTGQKKTCGHCEVSIGEYTIQQLLLDNNIIFEHDIVLPLFMQEYNKRLRFDFVIYDDYKQVQRIVEFDGRQHITGPDTNYWGHTTDTLETIQEKDEIKNTFCHNHNIPIVRIPYWKRDNITLDDIFSDKFVIKKEG